MHACSGTAKLTSESDDSDSDGDNNFVSAVTDVVQRLQREKEAQEGGRRSGGVTSDMFEALQVVYEKARAVVAATAVTVWHTERRGGGGEGEY